jgi:hypothetical protein
MQIGHSLQEAAALSIPSRNLQHQKVSLEGEEMQNLKWILIAFGVLVLGSAAVSLAPDIRRYARMRAM